MERTHRSQLEPEAEVLADGAGRFVTSRLLAVSLKAPFRGILLELGAPPNRF